MVLTEQEVEWHRAREELYRKLVRSCQNGLNEDTIRRVSEQNFVSNGVEFVPRRYEFAHEDDAVVAVVAAIPPQFAKVCRVLGEEVTALLPRQDATGHSMGYVNDQATMHMTLFLLSQPDDLMPHAKTRHPQTIARLREWAKRFPPLVLQPRRVLLASSGAVLLLYDVDETSESDPFTVDKLRELARQNFSPYPQHQSAAIMHTTLARILMPGVDGEAVARIHKQCEVITDRLREKNHKVVIQDLWHVDETHHYWGVGDTTVIPLGGGSLETHE